MRSRRFAFLLTVCAIGATGLAAGDAPPNGISVSPPKVFDNRSLVLMLEQLERQLQSIRVVEDQKDKLLAALANMQGGRITEVARQFSASGPDVPAVTTTEKPAADGGALSITERKTERAASSPAPPDVQAPPSNLSISPSFGTKAEDLLTDQVSLGYQIMNIRLLLERALSDRLYQEKPRLQVVLGFQVGIDPPKEAKDKAAFVELTVRSPDGNPLTLISMMPFEKTYNAFAIDRRSNAFGGAAIAGVVALGYSERRGSESLYVYKDADTLALGNPRPAADSDTVTFGWEFRPVLGRRSVSPGLRQMFAVLALPVADEAIVSKPLTVRMRTYWREFDKGKGTLSGGLRSINEAGLGTAHAMTTAAINAQLGPRIEDVQWRTTDEKTAIVTIAGKNLFTGTQIVFGPKVYDSPANGLILKSDQLAELRTTVGELAFGDGAVSGRYGDPVALKATEHPGAGIEIGNVSYTDQPNREFLAVTVSLRSRDGQPLILPPEQPIMTVGSEVANSVYGELQGGCQLVPRTFVRSKRLTLSRAATLIGKPSGASIKEDCWTFTGLVSAARLKGEPVVSIKYPFRGDEWQATFPIYEPSVVSGVTRLGTLKKAKMVITGRGFDDGWRVILDREYTSPELDVQDTLMRFDVDAEILSKFKNLIVQPAAGNPIVLKLPGDEPPSLKPSIDGGQQKSVKKETNTPVAFTGKDLRAVKAARFEGSALNMVVGDDGKKITVYLTRAVTAKPGTAIVLLETDGEPIPLTLTIES
jgi:hypothetical protein